MPVSTSTMSRTRSSVVDEDSTTTIRRSQPRQRWPCQYHQSCSSGAAVASRANPDTTISPSSTSRTYGWRSGLPSRRALGCGSDRPPSICYLAVAAAEPVEHGDGGFGELGTGGADRDGRGEFSHTAPTQATHAARDRRACRPATPPQRAASGHRRAGRSPKEHTGQDHSDVGLRVRVSRRGLSLSGTDAGD
jgi:hypothetical protein